MFDILQLNDMLVPELRELAERLGVQGYRKLNKKELVYKILDYQALAEGSERPAFEPGEDLDIPASITSREQFQNELYRPDDDEDDSFVPTPAVKEDPNSDQSSGDLVEDDPVAADEGIDLGGVLDLHIPAVVGVRNLWLPEEAHHPGAVFGGDAVGALGCGGAV